MRETYSQVTVNKKISKATLAEVAPVQFSIKPSKPQYTLEASVHKNKKTPSFYRQTPHPTFPTPPREHAAKRL